MTQWKVFNIEQIKKSLKICLAGLIPVANTQTPGLVQYHLENALVCQLPFYLISWPYSQESPLL